MNARLQPRMYFQKNQRRFLLKVSHPPHRLPECVAGVKLHGSGVDGRGIVGRAGISAFMGRLSMDSGQGVS